MFLFLQSRNSVPRNSQNSKLNTCHSKLKKNDYAIS
jgi:hypothetical protein